MNSKVFTILLIFIMAVPLGASAQGESGNCLAGIALSLPNSQDSYSQDFLRGVEFAIGEVNTILGTAGTLICFEIDGMDAENMPGDSSEDAQDAPIEDGGGTILDSLTEGNGELMRFLVTVSYEMNGGGDWPGPWGHYWLYTDSGSGNSNPNPGQAPFGQIEGNYDISPTVLNRLSFVQNGDRPRIHKVEFNHFNAFGDWQRATDKSLFIAGSGSSGEAMLVELTAAQISQLDAVTVGWSVPEPQRGLLWQFLSAIADDSSEEVISIAFVLADAGTVTLADSA